MAGRVEELVARAKSIISSGEPGRMELWRAYVSVEYAVMDLKLRRGLEGEPLPARLSRKSKVDVALARALLERIDLEVDEKKLLYDLRSCRDVLKALVAGYARRSTMS